MEFLLGPITQRINVPYELRMKWTWHHSKLAVEEVSFFSGLRVVLLQLLSIHNKAVGITNLGVMLLWFSHSGLETRLHCPLHSSPGSHASVSRHCSPIGYVIKSTQLGMKICWVFMKIWITSKSCWSLWHVKNFRKHSNGLLKCPFQYQYCGNSAKTRLHSWKII